MVAYGKKDERYEIVVFLTRTYTAVVLLKLYRYNYDFEIKL